MPQKSKKSKSKRQTLKQKYKVLKKVREHHRKKRKEAKKNGTLNKGPKDPGIPNAWPFKDELLQGLRASKERAAAHQKALREARTEAAAAAAAGGGLQAVGAAAAARGQAYEVAAAAGRVGAAPGGGYVDYSLKAFYRDFARVVEASDVIIEVLDARDPAGSRCPEVERFVRRMGASKKIVLLMNKIDLVPREVTEEWLKHLREELPAVAFKCSTQRQAANLGRKQLSMDAGLGGSECLGADTLLQLLKNYARGATGLKQSITVGVVGLPNVGKSSLINSLKRARVTQVGNAPGVTKGIQEVHLDKQVTLLDSPGVVFSDAGADGAAAAALRNCVRVEQLEDPVLPVAEIVARCPAKQLMALYRVPTFTDVDGFLTHVATARGKLRRGGVVDTIAAARIVLQDWNDGRIPYFTRPQKRETEVAGTAAVVADWGADFDAETVFAAEGNAMVAGLPSLQDAATGFFQTETLGEAHVGLDAAAAAAEAGDGDEEMSGSEEESEEEDGGDSDAMEEEEAPAAGRVTRASAKASQNELLYAQKGQFNPHAARAQRKRVKKVVGGDGDGSGSDFDFEEDWEGAQQDNAFAQLASGSDEEEEEEEDASDME